MKFALSFIALLFALSSGSFAQQQNANEACKGDRLKYCSAAGSDKKAIRKCMKNNRKQLSEACKDASKARQKNNANAACNGDRLKYCSAVGSDKKAILKCLKNNRKRLSEACKKARKARRKKR